MTACDQGYRDAQRGHTACPYGPNDCAQWRKGYDLAATNGEAEFPRFGKLRITRR